MVQVTKKQPSSERHSSPPSSLRFLGATALVFFLAGSMIYTFVERKAADASRTTAEMTFTGSAERMQRDVVLTSVRAALNLLPPEESSWVVDNLRGSYKSNGDSNVNNTSSVRNMKKDASVVSSPGALPNQVGKWKNKYGLVQVLESRFMQLQPDLLHLGKARLDLFKTFTLASVVTQTTQEFIWIIRTDPKLNRAVLDPLVEYLRPYPNILLVGFNGLFGDFRAPNFLDTIPPEVVFSGDYEMLKDYHAAVQERIFLHTRLDCDDAIYREHLQRTQESSYQSMVVANQSTVSSGPQFRAFCSDSHLEWSYFNAWDKSSDKGHLFGKLTPNFCIVAGLTYALQVGTNPKDVETGHQRLSKTYPKCEEPSSNNINCLERISDPRYKYLALRSRTPTSTAMDGVVPGPAIIASTEWKEKQKYVWDKYISENFGIGPLSIKSLRKRLSNDMENILTDALAGQCSRREFTCKKHSSKVLSTLLETVKQYSSTS
eukprot:CAMPEP_0172445196 /NCGR_PEP_ID=MMETSP1065-20121228/5102_1 /TAXON_ID=265537 /ORGANISM="Amphiprora paludosa, Strain CCMP125" /LENGTH=488 /DNA_ID=CAMNT_0013195995 /DNA_START=17 /DNA_END=1483 /DNA_ORIENTATION=+